MTHASADELVARLAARGVGARGYYRTPLHLQPAMAPYAPSGRLPAAERIADENLALPMGPTLAPEHAHEVVAAVADALAAV